jgi:hypothetical protein
VATKSKTTTAPTAAELSRQALAEAESLLALRQEQQEQAHAAVGELTGRLSSGDDTVRGADLGTAHDEVERVGYLLTAAEGQVMRARRALVNDDTTLAELFADVLAETFDGLVPVKVTGVPTEARPSDDGSAVAWIVQDKPTGKGGGVLSGVLDVVFHRPRLFAPLDAQELASRCRSRGYTVQTHQVGQVSTDEGWRDSMRLTVERAFHSMPELSSAPTDDAVRDFARTVNGDLGQSVASNRPTGISSDDVAGSRSWAELIGCSVTASTLAQDGSVQLTVETVSKVKPGPGLVTGYANQRVRQTIAGQVQRMVDGVGRVMSAEPVSIDMPDPVAHSTGHPWTVTARFVLAYRLA